jgi:hypothetical protein
MGLDCYIVHGNDRKKAFTHEDDPRIKDINLCGGMLSGHGADGSFRGKWYDPLVSELLEEDCVWYPDQGEYIQADQLKKQAKVLADLIHAVESDAREEERTLKPDTIIYQTKHPYPYEYSYQEIQDLELLLRCGSERGCVMECWY